METLPHETITIDKAREQDRAARIMAALEYVTAMMSQPEEIRIRAGMLMSGKEEPLKRNPRRPVKRIK